MAKSVLELCLVCASLQHESGKPLAPPSGTQFPNVSAASFGSGTTAELSNPRFMWTHADESVVGAMIEVSRSCHSCTFTETGLVQTAFPYVQVMTGADSMCLKTRHACEISHNTSFQHMDIAVRVSSPCLLVGVHAICSEITGGNSGGNDT